jgi:hypothetical protein
LLCFPDSTAVTPSLALHPEVQLQQQPASAGNMLQLKPSQAFASLPAAATATLAVVTPVEAASAASAALPVSRNDRLAALSLQLDKHDAALAAQAGQSTTANNNSSNSSSNTAVQVRAPLVCLCHTNARKCSWAEYHSLRYHQVVAQCSVA